MKKIFITLFVSLTFIFISWKYHEVKFEDPNKDKLLIELLKYVLRKAIISLKKLMISYHSKYLIVI